MQARRGAMTLIGNAWLHQPSAPPQREPAIPPHFHDIDSRSRSAMRNCIFIPVPPELEALAPPVSPAAMRAPAKTKAKVEASIVPHRRDPRHDVRMLPVYVPDAHEERARPPDLARSEDAITQRRAELYAEAQARAAGRRPRREQVPASETKTRWFEDPIAMGTLLLVLPPVGIAIAWTSKRYSNDARWALTVMTGLMMCLASAIVVALVLRS